MRITAERVNDTLHKVLAMYLEICGLLCCLVLCVCVCDTWNSRSNTHNVTSW